METGYLPTRRDLCCGAAAAALFCCLPALKAEAEALADPVSPARITLAEVAPGFLVAQGVHAEANPENLGAIANVGVVIGEEAVAVIDSGGCRLWGRRLREAIRARTDRPIRYLIQTHMHPDHIFGAAAFAEDAPMVIGHRNLPAGLAAREAFYRKRLSSVLGDLAAGSAIIPPTVLVQDEHRIDLGRRVLRLRAHRPAHTDNDLSVFDTETRMLWTGDLLFMERVPSLDGSLAGWLAAIEELRRMPADRVVPGHGPASAAFSGAFDAEARYLSALREGIRAVQKRGGTMEEAVATVGLEERAYWRLFDDYNPHNVTAAFHELEWE